MTFFSSPSSSLDIIYNPVVTPWISIDNKSVILYYRLVDKKITKYILERLKEYEPLKIILFGSMAHGKNIKGSEVDLLILKNTKANLIDRIQEVISLLYSWEKRDLWQDLPPIEPLVYTEEEIKEGIKNGDPFLQEIMEYGKTIYER